MALSPLIVAFASAVGKVLILFSCGVPLLVHAYAGGRAVDRCDHVVLSLGGKEGPISRDRAGGLPLRPAPASRRPVR